MINDLYIKMDYSSKNAAINTYGALNLILKK